ncbi:MAG: glucosyltransferase domain-containing protein [Pseudomonadota bacterium]
MERDILERVAAWWGTRLGHLTGVFAILFALSWIAYGIHAAGMNHSLDDWWFVLDPDRIGLVVVGSGRWMHGLAITVLSGGLIAPGVTLFAMLAMQAIAIGLLLNEMGCRSRVIALLAMALLLFHPMGIESVQIEQNHIAVGLSHLMLIISGILTWRVALALSASPRPWRGAALNAAAAVLLFAIGSAGFQQFAVLGAIAFFALWASEALRGNGSQPGTGMAGIRIAVWRLAVLGVVSVLGIALYYASAFGAKALFGVPSQYAYYNIASGFVSSRDILALKGESLPRVILKFWTEAQHLIAWPETLALIAITVLAVAAGARTIAGATGASAQVLAAVGFAGAIGTALLLPFVLPGIRGHDAYSFNALAPLAFSQVILFILAARGFEGTRLSWVPLLLALYVAMNFVTAQNAAAVVALNDNRRDMLALNRLLAALEMTDSYKAAQRNDAPVKLMMIGAKPAPDPLGPYRIDETEPPLHYSRADCSLFSCGTSQIINGLMLISYDTVEYELTDPAAVDDALRREALARISESRPWPDPSGIMTLSNGVLMIYLGDTLRRDE